MKKNYKVFYKIYSRDGKKKSSVSYAVFAENLSTATRLANRMKYALYNSDKFRVDIDKITKLK